MARRRAGPELGERLAELALGADAVAVLEMVVGDRDVDQSLQEAPLGALRQRCPGFFEDLVRLEVATGVVEREALLDAIVH